MGNRLHRLRRRLLILERFPRINNISMGVAASIENYGAYVTPSLPMIGIWCNEKIDDDISFNTHNPLSYPYIFDINMNANIDMDCNVATPMLCPLNLDMSPIIYSIAFDISNPITSHILAKNMAKGIYRLWSVVLDSKSLAVAFDENYIFGTFASPIDAIKSLPLHIQTTSAVNLYSDIHYGSPLSLNTSLRSEMSFLFNEFDFVSPLRMPEHNIKCKCDTSTSAIFYLLKPTDVTPGPYINIIKFTANVDEIHMANVQTNVSALVDMTATVRLIKNAKLTDYGAQTLSNLSTHTLFDMNYVLLN